MPIKDKGNKYNQAVIILFMLILTAGCSKETKKDEAPVPTTPSIEENALGDSDSGKALGLKTIHFALASAVLNREAKLELKENSNIIINKPQLKVQIEGHCDQRGGIQYNISLGERRANSVKKYLIDQGISSDRLSVVSYGKERPLDRAETEEAYSKNRRANFAITMRM